jgi:hypothetical protein
MTTSREAKIGAGDYTYLGGGCRIVEDAQGGNFASAEGWIARAKKIHCAYLVG